MHERALRHDRICPDHQRPARAREIRHRLQEARAVEELRRQEVSQVVLRAGAEAVAAADGVDPVAREDAVAVRVAAMSSCELWLLAASLASDRATQKAIRS